MAMIVGMMIPAQAVGKSVEGIDESLNDGSKGQYIEEETGDTITLEQVENKTRSLDSEGIIMLNVYRNDA